MENLSKVPDVHLRLAHCKSWVKRWSEAMDFLQTFFKTNIFVAFIFDARKLTHLWQKYEPVKGLS